jgi:hypothetical protein
MKLLLAFALLPFLVIAQLDTDRTAGGGLVSDSKGKAPQNLIQMDELNMLDQKFHRELDAAQEAEDREKFADAEQKFSQLSDMERLVKLSIKV